MINIYSQIYISPKKLLVPGCRTLLPRTRGFIDGKVAQSFRKEVSGEKEDDETRGNSVISINSYRVQEVSFLVCNKNSLASVVFRGEVAVVIVFFLLQIQFISSFRKYILRCDL